MFKKNDTSSLLILSKYTIVNITYKRYISKKVKVVPFMIDSL